MDPKQGQALGEAAARLGRAMPASVLRSLARAVAKGEREGLASTLSVPDTRSRVESFIEAWSSAFPDLEPPSVAAALYACAASAQDRPELELVWSGPKPPGNKLRRTDRVLLEMIESAKASITIIAFAAYDIDDLRQALLAAAGRGVKIRFVLETKETSDGHMTLKPAKALGEDLLEAAEVLVWPLDRRKKNAKGDIGVLHAKAAVVDREWLLVSSANLTGYALDLNMELGLAERGSGLAREVVEHVDRLIAAGYLTPC